MVQGRNANGLDRMVGCRKGEKENSIFSFFNERKYTRIIY